VKGGSGLETTKPKKKKPHLKKRSQNDNERGVWQIKSKRGRSLDNGREKTNRKRKKVSSTKKGGVKKRGVLGKVFQILEKLRNPFSGCTSR